MTLKIVDFESWHAWEVMKDAGLEDRWTDIEGTLGQIKTQNTATIVDEEGPIAVGGTMELWKNRHLAWVFLSERAKKYPIALTRLSRRVLKNAEGRIEASARADLMLDIRWLEVLGFEHGEFLPKYGPDGSNHRSFVQYNGVS